jgi:hypothetical protein
VADAVEQKRNQSDPSGGPRVDEPQRACRKSVPSSAESWQISIEQADHKTSFPPSNQELIGPLRNRFVSNARKATRRRRKRKLLREKRSMLGKLTILFGLLALAIGPAFAEAPIVAETSPAGAAAAVTTENRVFDIFRDGNKIGTETIEIEKDGDTTNVKFTTHISVVVMFIQAYRFDHSATETWTGGQFVSYNSLTDDNGTKHSVMAVAKPDKLEFEIDGTRSEAAPDLIPASLWSKDFIDRTNLFDSDTGKQLSIKVTDLGVGPLLQQGTTIQAHHYKISGDLDRDLWFDGDTLVRIKLLGSDHSTIISDLIR